MSRLYRQANVSSSSFQSQEDSPTSSHSPASSTSSILPEEVEELALLDAPVDEHSLTHETATAPLILRDAFVGSPLSKRLPQYGVLGSVLAVHNQKEVESINDRRVYLNTNAPFSAVVCGVQGSGKSHTVGVLLESMMIKDKRLGKLFQPLSGLVLHYGEAGGAAQPCEAAYQAISDDPLVDTPHVRVYVSPSSLETMQQLYFNAFGGAVEVLPLKFTHQEIDAKSLLSMMCVSNHDETPLYIQVVLSIMRDLGKNFSFGLFKANLKSRKFNRAQLSGLRQRMDLLESFLTSEAGTPRFAPKQLTIVDLTDPFIDSASACSIFEIMTRLFLRARVDTGKVLVVDEGHKYLTGKGSATLTQTLLSITRQQRHLGIRVIISTQEPTVLPTVLLDLCSITIMHRFSSIAWFDHLAKHVPSELTDKAFDAIVKLKTGQAIVLAPAGIGMFGPTKGEGSLVPSTLGRRYLVIKTRQRITKDGGCSILVVGGSRTL